MMDGDGQHNPEDITQLLEKIDKYDMVVGARTGESDSHLHRNLANKLYNLMDHALGYLAYSIKNQRNSLRYSRTANIIPP
jgi:hypothetical protein